MPFVIIQPKDMVELIAPVVQHAKLVDVRVFEIHGEVLDPAAADELAPIEDLSANLTIGRGEETLIYRLKFNFTVKGKGDEDAVRISLEIGALFDFPNEGEPGGDVDSEALAAFGRTTVQMAVHPYLRSAVADLTLRLGCPAVTLDLMTLVEE
ncbi:hypothetical protein [Streptomyces sp. NPDC056948]|uniref:hypothetical protein n=1 Tax=Streptomyces sp. NPDC056948 TaxID=3345975 RepID=UPI00363E883B